jgi:acyl dehydratase
MSEQSPVRPEEAPAPVTFETLEALKECAGREVAVSAWTEIPQAQIQAFADATGDRQWIHVDVERARAESPFRAPVVHGFLTVSLLPVLMQSALRIRGFRYAVNFGLNHVRFPSAIPSGSMVRARFVLQDFNPAPGYAQCTWFVTFERQGGKLPSCVAEWIVRYYR